VTTAPQIRLYSPTYAHDRAEIEDLMARYLFAMDWGDLDAYREMFTEDGELDYAGGTAKGRDDVLATVKRFKERIGQHYLDADGNPAVLRHIIAQTVIRVEGDRAWSTAFWYEMANNGPNGTPLVGTFGTYEDELRREDGRWLFSRRRINNEFLNGRGTGAENPVSKVDALASAG
jgi:hypothetical protein